MAQTGYTPISLYHSTTAAAAPTSGNLVAGELALNTVDEKLYFKNSVGTVKLLASSSGAAGDVVGPASATDNAIVRFDGTTGKLVQNSVVTIADSTGDISGVGVLNATTLDATNVEVTNIKAKDGTASATIADSTGVMTIGSSVLTTTDINGGTIDGTAIGGSTPAAGAFTTLSATKATSGDVATFTTGTVGSESLYVYVDANTAALFNTAAAGAGRNGIQLNPTNVIVDINAATIGTFSSTGLAVTGALSATTTGAIGSGSPLGAQFDVFKLNAGTPVDVGIFNSDNTNGSSSAQLRLYTGGASGGDPIVNWEINGVTRYYMGIDNSNSDKLVIGQGYAPGASDYVTIDSTGLAVTGAISSTGNLTAVNALLTGGTITTGSTTALSLATSGGTGLRINNIASQVNYLDVVPNVTGAAPYIQSNGSDTNVTLAFSSKGTGNVDFYTNTTATRQVQITHTASANRYITLTGSNGGNPTIGTSAGSLAVSTNLAVTGTLSGASRYSTGNNLTDDALFSAQNTGGTMYFGVDNSIGSFTGGAYGNFWYGAGSTPMTFLIGGTARATISSTGLAVTGTLSATGVVTFSNYGAGTATFSAAGVISSVSDETWKTKDGVPTDPDAMLKKLEPGYWYYNDEKKKTFGADRQLGFYAQNVNAAIGPEAAPEPEEGKPWGYYDRSVLAITVMSLQKALSTIEQLTAKVAALETK